MAYYVPYLSILLLNIFFSIASACNPEIQCCKPPMLSVGSQQIKFWSKNVDNKMPKSIFCKLSPLSESEADAFTSLVGKDQYFSSNPKFCKSANLVCSRVVNPLPMDNIAYHVHFTDKVAIPFDKVNPWAFFRLSSLQKGNKVTLPDIDHKLPNRAFLPSKMARNVPLVASELQSVFPTVFSIPSTKAAMDASLAHCNAETVKGERRRCLKTLEDMIEFSRDSLGQKRLVVLASDITNGVANQVVTIGNVTPYKNDKIVACHEVFFPFAAYYCHMLPTLQLYEVDVVNPKMRGTTNKIFAICHMDTSAWTPKHVAFKVLKSSPGKGEACHWISQMDLLWIGYDD